MTDLKRRKLERAVASGDRQAMLKLRRLEIRTGERCAREDLLQALADLLGKHDECNPSAEVRLGYDGDIAVLSIVRSYEAPAIPVLALMLEVGNFFGSHKVNDRDIRFKGCESCDYGSMYGYKLFVHNPLVKLEPFECGILADCDDGKYTGRYEVIP